MSRLNKATVRQKNFLVEKNLTNLIQRKESRSTKKFGLLQTEIVKIMCKITGGSLL